MRGVPRCEDHTSSDAQRGGRRGCITEMMSLRAVLAPSGNAPVLGMRDVVHGDIAPPSGATIDACASFMRRAVAVGRWCALHMA